MAVYKYNLILYYLSYINTLPFICTGFLHPEYNIIIFFIFEGLNLPSSNHVQYFQTSLFQNNISKQLLYIQIKETSV